MMCILNIQNTHHRLYSQSKFRERTCATEKLGQKNKKCHNFVTKLRLILFFFFFWENQAEVDLKDLKGNNNSPKK